MGHGNCDFEPLRYRKAALSRHANKRAQQRGIGPESLPLLLAYGKREFDGKGGVRYLMTEDSLRHLRKAVGASQQVEALAGVYAVVSADQGTVITIGHRHS